MNGTSAAAFWSYAQEDNDLDGGAILRLANCLKNEFALVSGQQLEIFVDRTSIEWGEEWRARIDQALVQTTFFMPVLTPRYFMREECRRELVTFASQAQSLGVRELVMPILYIPVPNFGPEHPDEPIALAARMQCTDWTSLRLEDENGPSYRQAVSKLVARLMEVESSVAAMQVESESEAEGLDEQAGLAEAVEVIASLLSDWGDAVETDPLVTAQFEATREMFTHKLSKLTRGQAGARFALLVRQATELMPLEERHLALAEIYLSRTVELDPYVATVVRIVRTHPESRPLLAELEAGVAEAMPYIERQDRYAVGLWARSHAHVSRVMRELAEISERASGIVTEANAIVSGWDAELRSLGGDATQAPSDREGATPAEDGAGR
jgi:hypothetical protein